MENTQFYKTYLEDYSFPRYASVVKPYYGTEEDIYNVISTLADDEWTSKRYREIIEAVYTYDTDDKRFETVATIAGQVHPVMTPVEKIGHFETTLTNHSWIYTDYYGKVFPCQADSIEVYHVLLRTDKGYDRCMKATITGFSVCYHSAGWIQLCRNTKSFPGIVTYDEKRHIMNLMVCVDSYGFDELAVAASDLVDTACINMAALTADLLGEV